jgi:hypothetical protein
VTAFVALNDGHGRGAPFTEATGKREPRAKLAGRDQPNGRRRPRADPTGRCDRGARALRHVLREPVSPPRAAAGFRCSCAPARYPLKTDCQFSPDVSVDMFEMMALEKVHHRRTASLVERPNVFTQAGQ